jgi:hypothetical protein
MKKLWLKSDPAVTAEVIRELHGVVAAELHNPHMKDTDHPEDYLGFLAPDEWSDVELVPVPLCTAPTLYIAVVGKQDPEEVTYVTFDNEVALRVAMQIRDDILGFFEVSTPSSMLPA